MPSQQCLEACENRSTKSRSLTTTSPSRVPVVDTASIGQNLISEPAKFPRLLSFRTFGLGLGRFPEAVPMLLQFRWRYPSRMIRKPSGLDLCGDAGALSCGMIRRSRSGIAFRKSLSKRSSA